MTKNFGWGKRISHPSKGAKYSRKDGTYRDTNTGILYSKDGKPLGLEQKHRNIYGKDPIRKISIGRIKIKKVRL